MTVVCLEIGKKKVFASALDWPGWSRSGRNVPAALEALATYVDRYAAVVEVAGLSLPDRVLEFAVTETLPGDMTTDFGAPGAIAALEREPVRPGEHERMIALLEGSWAVWDQIVALTPAGLRKGPRGGGRDRDKMVDHVLGAEAAYGRKIGVRCRQPTYDDAVGIAAVRADLLRSLRDSASPQPASAWPARYAVRRIAWHALDHAWEMQDRSEPD